MNSTSAEVILTPIASGLMVPSASQPGPLPMKISRPVPANVLPLIAKSPWISRKSPKSKSRSWMTNWKVEAPDASR